MNRSVAGILTVALLAVSALAIAGPVGAANPSPNNAAVTSSDTVTVAGGVVTVTPDTNRGVVCYSYENGTTADLSCVSGTHLHSQPFGDLVVKGPFEAGGGEFSIVEDGKRGVVCHLKTTDSGTALDCTPPAPETQDKGWF